MKERKSPQEKKQLSYTKDRRNWYGENNAGSRKNIARNKRVRHRSERQFGQQWRTAALGPVDEDIETDLDQRLARSGPRGRWRKFPDVQLGLFVTKTLADRVAAGSSATQTERARMARIWRSTEFDGRNRHIEDRLSPRIEP